MKKLHTIFVISILITLISNHVYSYDDVITHPALTDISVSKSILQSYLSKNLGTEFSNNYTSIIDGEQVIEILKGGSKLEDTPNCRAASHFLNPLKDWDIAGVSDTNETILGAFVINPACFVTAPFSNKFSINKYSDVTWATGYTSPTVQGEATGNDMDWNAARNYYRLALTETDKNRREGNFAKTFQTLGQVMHLLQDMAVPAHVRNDFTAHLAFQKVNSWLPNKWYGNTYEWYVKNNESLVNSAMTSSAVVRPPNNLLTALWDANKYDGNNPSGGTVQGLSEYTNANFFSESTIFAELKDPTDIHYFPRPNKADTNALEQEMLATTMEVTAEDGVQDRTIYVTKNTGGYKVAAYSFLGQRVARRIVADGIAPFSYVSEWEYNLDDEVYKDYANLLIPRAVGYSAGLLDYFFRGQLEITLPSRGVYALTEGMNGAGFSQVRLQARNTTLGSEIMPAGQVTLVARYKVAQADPFQGAEVPVGAEFVYNVATLDTPVAIQRDQPVELAFAFATPIPLWATDLTLQVVYSGRLGNETAAGFAGEEDAVAVGFANVSEPSPYDFINGTDLICLNGAVVASGSAEALAARDAYGEPFYWNNDVFPDALQNIFLKFSPVSQPVSASSGIFDISLSYLPPGSHLRFYFIANTLAATTNYSHQVQPIPTDERDPFQHRLNTYRYGISGLVNEEKMENGVTLRTHPTMTNVRGLPVWKSISLLKKSYPSITSCSTFTAPIPLAGPVPLTSVIP